MKIPHSPRSQGGDTGPDDRMGDRMGNGMSALGDLGTQGFVNSTHVCLACTSTALCSSKKGLQEEDQLTVVYPVPEFLGRNGAQGGVVQRHS